MDQIANFLNSNFFIALVTLVVGAAAFLIYRLQKRDKKREVANIVLLEIQSAERKLKEIKKSISGDSGKLPNDLRLLQNDSWSQFSYMFIRDLDRDEWDSLSDFYDNCKLIDETIKFNNAAFWNDVEQIRANKQRVLADYADVSARKLKGSLKGPVNEEDKVAVEQFDELTEKFDHLYMSKQGRFSYTPQKTLDDARQYVSEIDMRISQKNVGIKLKKLANIAAG